MTVFEFALFRFAAGFMSPAELERARALAKKADVGDQAALRALRDLTMDVLADAKEREPSAKKIL